MGRLKDQLIQEEERGWRAVSRKLVCDNCVSEEALVRFIRDNGVVAPCAYCGLAPEEAELLCVPFDDLMDVIGERVNHEFTGAHDEGIPWDREEDEYAFAVDIFDTSDLIVDVIGLDATDAVLEEIIKALPEQSWCRKQFFSLSLSEALAIGWGDFVEKVKYETRYLFTLPPRRIPVTANPPAPAELNSGSDYKDDTISIGDSGWEIRTATDEEIASLNIDIPLSMGDPEFGVDYDRGEGIPPYEMLDAIGKIVGKLNIISTIEPGTIIFRVRVHDANETLSTVQDLGPPPKEIANQPNRMSPAGIVMFYGAFERNTAVAETFQADRDGAAKKVVSVAQFETLVRIVALDLTKLPPVPSFFESTSREQREGIRFLHEFVEDLIEPVERDGREHIDYVPTQVVTEYFRHRFLTEDGRRLEGIFYPSSRSKDGTACVLFFDQFNCGVPAESWRDNPQKLRLLEGLTERIQGAASNDLE